MEEEFEREVSWAEGRAKDLSFSVGAGASVRVVKGGRLGFASGTDTSSKGIYTLFERAVESAKGTYPDIVKRLPGLAETPNRSSDVAPFVGRSRSLQKFSLSGTMPEKSGNYKCQGISFAEKTLLDRLRILEQRVLAGDRRIKKALSLAFHEAGGIHAIVNTRGISVAEPWSAVSFSTEILGASGKETETCWGSTEKREWADLNPESIVDDARARLLTSFGAKPLRSGAWPVIFTPRVGVDLVELFSQTVLADAVQKGRSCVAERMAKKVASPLVNFEDDGTLAGGLSSGQWDDEGVPKQRTVVVAGGILRSFLYDSVTAGQAKGVSTGNASRSGRETLPSPGVSNFYLTPGTGSCESLYRSTPRAFVVRDVIGMHTADPVSGDFSVGASGFLFEKGTPGRAVRGVTLSGNLLDLFACVDAVADDLTWQGFFGSPTFRVKELSVGGS